MGGEREGRGGVLSMRTEEGGMLAGSFNGRSERSSKWKGLIGTVL